MLRFLRALVSAVLALLVISATLAPAAHAGQEDGQSDGAVTWMVRPSDGVGEDERAWVELELDPGEVAEEHLLVRNLSASPVTFRLSAADGYFTDTGRFNMLTSDKESVDAGTWIELRDDIEVEPGADAIVPFTITVPVNATPGDHPAGVAAAVRSGEGDQVGVESRVGFRVMTRVTGELAPSATAEVSGEYGGSPNPFEAGRVDAGYSVENTGNTRLSVVPHVTLTTLFGLVSHTVVGEEIVEIAPGESRAAEVTFPSVWPLFAYTAEVDAVLEPVGEGLAAGEIEPASAEAVVAAIPWPQLVVAAIAALLVWLLWRDRRTREQRVTEAVAQARQDVRAELAAERRPAPEVPLQRRIAAIAVGGTLALTLTACVAPESGTSASEAPLASAPAATPAGSASPEPGRTVEATAPVDLEGLRGVRIATVVPDASAPSVILRDAVRVFAEEHGLVVDEFVADGDEGSIDSAFQSALATEPHVVVGLGVASVDTFAYGTPQFLDQDFLLIGAQVAEPTANIAAVVWDGATSRGSGAPADGDLDDATVTGERASEALSVGLDTVMSGMSGIVLHLPG